MAVMLDADPIDRALDQIATAALHTETDLAAATRQALAIAALWHQVFDGAMRRGDHELARIASDEWRSAQKVFRSLERLSDLRGSTG